MNDVLFKEKAMNCPYFRESYFGICVAPDSVHVPSIDEMERLCFKPSYVNCPNLLSLKDAPDTGDLCTADGALPPYADQIAQSLFETGRDRGTGQSHQ